jgi:hypothetical protein
VGHANADRGGGTLGNHDNLRFSTPGGYQEQLLARLERINGTAYCDGELGVSFACNYKGVLMAMTGVGTRATPAEGAAYLERTLAAYPSVWQACLWHKNQRLYQTGLKVDEVGWEVYETCREHGAIILTGHEHSYARTHLMSNFELTQVASTANTLVLEPGKTFCTVAGLGGKDIRNWDRGANENPWWAACAAEDNGVDYGALLCTFNLDGDARRAACQFSDISGRTWDSFLIESTLQDAGRPRHARPATAVRTHRTEVTVAGPEADGQVDLATGRMHAAGAELAFGPGQEVHLTFASVPLAGATAFKNVQLQVMGARAGQPHPLFLVRALLPHGGRTEAAVAWEVDADDFSPNTVWHSPNLAPLLREVAASAARAAPPTTVTLVLTSNDPDYAIYATDADACRAPTLATDL